jgi:hypothetical protein
VVVAAVEFDDEVGVLPVGVDKDPVDADVETRDRDLVSLAELQEVNLKLLVGMRQLWLVDLKRLAQEPAAGAPVRAHDLKRFEVLEVELLAEVELRERAADERELGGGREIDERPRYRGDREALLEVTVLVAAAVNLDARDRSDFSRWTPRSRTARA